MYFYFYKFHEEKNNNYTPSINYQIEKFIQYFLQKYEIIKSLFNIIEYSLDNKKTNIYEEFLLLLNSQDLEKKILENIYCNLDTKQKTFQTSNKIDISQSAQFLNILKSIRMSNEELLEELNG
jgi:hypothetical protein